MAALVALALMGFGVRVLPTGSQGAELTARAAPTSGTIPPVATPSSATAAPTTSARKPAPLAGSTTKATAKPKKKVKKVKVKVPTNGPGTFRRAHEHEAAATKTGTLRRFDVRVEKGLQLDPDDAALLMAKVLNDKRSWRGSGRWRFQLVEAGESADLHAYIATPGTTDRLCAPLLTRGEVSCQNGNRVVLNAKRWTFGVKYYGDDVKNYRRYLINHEFGHALGHQHVSCPRRGQLAPVMMQQTKGLDGCRKNPWPLPAGD